MASLDYEFRKFRCEERIEELLRLWAVIQRRLDDIPVPRIGSRGSLYRELRMLQSQVNERVDELRIQMILRDRDA